MIVRPASRVSPANTATCSSPVSALNAILVRMFTLNRVSTGIARLNGLCGFTCGCSALAWGWKNSSPISSTVTITVTGVPKCDTHRPIPNPGRFTSRITRNSPTVSPRISVWFSSIHAARGPSP